MTPPSSPSISPSSSNAPVSPGASVPPPRSKPSGTSACCGGCGCERSESHRLRVAVLCGGPDAERPVSLNSGRGVFEALRAVGGLDVSHHEIHTLTQADLSGIAADVFFPVLHGAWGEGGVLQELLERDGRPFVTSGSRAARLAMDKIESKKIAVAAGVRTAEWCELRSPADPLPLAVPCVLKPIDDGSSVDVFICRSDRDVATARAGLHAKRARFMAERFIPGRELTVGIVGTEVNSLIEIKPNVEFYDYEAKYTREDTNYIVNPAVPRDVAPGVCADALKVFTAIGCRDLARIDFRYDDTPSGDGRWYFLEINTIPGFTSHSLVPKGAAARGESMSALCARLVQMAVARRRSALA